MDARTGAGVAAVSRAIDTLLADGGAKMVRWVDGAPSVTHERIPLPWAGPVGPIVVVDNVVDYFFSLPSEKWAAEDFPCIAPPWPRFVLESRAPRLINREGRIEHTNHGVRAASGVLVDTIRDGSGEWCLRFAMFARSGGDLAWMPYLLLVGVATDGSIRLLDDGQDCSPDSYIGMLALGDAPPDWEQRLGDLWPYLFALSLINCKNTTLREQSPPPKLARAAAKRGRPIHRHHVLEIEPMREVLRSEGQSDEVGLRRAVHICRGHFKDYREHGLFGRNHGVYWWSQYARGSASEGIVTKDYAVQAPVSS